MRASIKAILASLSMMVMSSAAVAAPTITSVVDDSRRVPLRGNTRPEAIPENDLGVLPDSYRFDHLWMMLKRSPEKKRALDTVTEELHHKDSPNFHRWLSVEERERRFGVDSEDIAKVSHWLRAHGFTVNWQKGMFMDFSGTAGQIRETFHTEMHALQAHGEFHIANMMDPEIPEALAPAVTGLVQLHDFMPKPAYYLGGTAPLEVQYVAPGDLHEIYNMNNLFTQPTPIIGSGVTIALIETSDPPNTTTDYENFQAKFMGITAPPPLTVKNPGGTAYSCTDPGPTGNSAENEAIIDPEWALAAAPGATIYDAVCANTSADPTLHNQAMTGSASLTWGGLVSIANLVEYETVDGVVTPPQIISVSYAWCESQMGTTVLSAVNALYQEAAAGGTSVFVASGDTGGATCDYSDNNYASTYEWQGPAVNGLASTIYNVAVGGTDFQDVFAQSQSPYWNTLNGSEEVSAESYVPEMVWNDSCASPQLATWPGWPGVGGVASAIPQFCNTSTGTGYRNTWASGGGPSAISAASDGGASDGGKPSWQEGVEGNPSDGRRDLPDVSIFAGGVVGEWGHAYVACNSNWATCGSNGTSTCNCSSLSVAARAGGTSLATPVWAGIQALVDQYKGEATGNPSPRYYGLASSQYSALGSSCNSTTAALPNSACKFQDIILGSSTVPCEARDAGSVCYSDGGTYGFMGTASKADYNATAGWDFATGLGTPNVYNLVVNY